jgi:hypothetical protein
MVRRVSPVGALLVLALTCCSRFPESQFTLRMDSQLPKFLDPNSTRSPEGYTARVEFYDSPKPARVTVTDPQHHTIFDQRGTFRWHPRDSYQGRGQIVYPSHIVVSFPSGEDIFEQRTSEPVLYLSDDAELWNSRFASNQALERTADRRDNLLSMTSTVKSEAQRALVSGRSASSR